MEVTKVSTQTAMIHCPASKKPTDEELQREYNYRMAENTVKKMVETGLISKEECDKFLQKCREYFSPYLADLA